MKKEVKEKYGKDNDFYSVYVDVGIDYNTRMTKRRAYKSLMNAIYKKKVDTIMIPSFKSMHASELNALHILLKLKKRGIHVLVGEEGTKVFSTAKHSEEEVEVARQLRLRNLSGIIIVDFIDMKEQEHKEELMKKLEDLLRRDPVKAVVVDMTKLGLVEITRKRTRKPIYEMLKS